MLEVQELTNQTEAKLPIRTLSKMLNMRRSLTTRGEGTLQLKMKLEILTRNRYKDLNLYMTTQFLINLATELLWSRSFKVQSIPLNFDIMRSYRGCWLSILMLFMVLSRKNLRRLCCIMHVSITRLDQCIWSMTLSLERMKTCSNFQKYTAKASPARFIYQPRKSSLTVKMQKVLLQFISLPIEETMKSLSI